MNQSDRLNAMFAKDIVEIEAEREKLLAQAPKAPTLKSLTYEQVFALFQELTGVPVMVPIQEYVYLQRAFLAERRRNRNFLRFIIGLAGALLVCLVKLWVAP